MSGRIFSATIIVMMVVGIFVGVDMGIEVVENVEGVTIYVPNDYSTIQEAIDAANEGDTVYVYGRPPHAGWMPYHENLYIDKSINLIGENPDTTIIDGMMSHYDTHTTISVSSNVHDVTISGFHIFMGGTGMRIEGSNINVTGNVFSDSGSGGSIAIFSTDNIISNNNFDCFRGITLYGGADRNRINGNTFLAREFGIVMYSTKDNMFTQNKLSGEGIIINGNSLEHWTTHTIDTSNTVNGKPIYYWKNRIEGKTPSNAGQVILANCEGIDIINHDFTDYSGIQLGFSPNNNIIGNTVSNNVYGIYLTHSNNNNISGNTVSNNYIEGIYLRHSSYNNITDNHLSRNGHWPAIWEPVDGVYDAGITLESSSKNRIFHNTLVENVIQARDDRNDNNWNNGYPSGGNYWSDYWGEDLFYGPNQDIPGSDGIGDTPHRFDPNSYDRYPLINQYNPPTGSNSPPVANAGADQNIYVGETVQFNSSSSLDPEGDHLYYYWDFGDGSHYSQDASPTCVYTKTGVYNVTLTVWDVYRNVNSDKCKITVVEVPNFSPTINANGDITAHEGDNITLYANASDANGDPLTYDWDFGDGCTSSLPNPSHTYQDNGLYEVSLTVTDDSGASANSSIHVNVLNVPPVASAGPDITVNEGESVLLSASATDSSPVDTLNYNWDLDNDGLYNDAVGQNVNWTWYDDGQFNISVNVTDDDGGSDCAYIFVTVNNVAPTVSLGISGSIINKKESVTIYGNYSDPGADSHIFLWDFGDGSFSNESIPNHIYTQDGYYTITFLVMDDDGGMGLDSQNVTVVNTPPVIDKIYATVETKDEKISSNWKNSTFVKDRDIPEADSPNSSNNHIIVHGNNDKTPGEQDTEISPTIESLVIEDENDSPVLDGITPQSVYINQRCFLFVKAYDPDDDEELTFSDDSELVEIDPVFGVITFIPKSEDIGYHFVNITVTDSQGEEDTRLMALKIEEPPAIIRESKKEESPFPIPLLLIPVIVLFIAIVMMHDFVTRKRAKAKQKKKPRLVPMKVKTLPKKQPQPMTIKRAVPPPSYSVMYASIHSDFEPLMKINSELDVVIEYPWEVPI